jgi:hypothetical protein
MNWIQDALLAATAVAGLAAATVVAILVAVHGLQALIRVLRHWDTSQAPAGLAELAIPGLKLKFEKVEQSSRELAEALEKEADRIRRLEANHLKMLLMQKRLEKRLPTGAQDVEGGR